MRKNNMLRIASVLLVAVLLTTCAISGVFANYYTKGNTGDKAQVAKWGVVITANAENDDADLFYPAYDGTVERSSAEGVSIDWDRLAPGTRIETWTPFTLAGTPEVDVKVTYTADVELTGWTIADGDDEGTEPDFYFPVVFTINGTEVNTSACTDVDGVEALLKAAIETASAERYEANQDLAATTVKTPTISWVWAFGDDTATKVKDTDLGNNAENSTISISIVAEVEQLD